MAEKIKFVWRRLPLWIRMLIVILACGLLLSPATWLFRQTPVLTPETPPTGATNLSLQVSMDVDDCEYTSSSVSWEISSFRAGNFMGSKNGAVRFTDVTIPQGSTILSANLSLYCVDNGVYGDDETPIQIVGIKESNTGNFSTNPDSRPETTAHLNISQVWTENQWYTFNVTDIVQEIINQDGWDSGNALGFKIKDNGAGTYHYVAFRDYHGDSTKAAKLEIEYQLTYQTPVLEKQGYTSDIIAENSTFYSYWKANNLSTVIFSWNASGAWQNFTVTTFSSGTTEGWANITKTLPNQVYLTIAYKWYCNDTNGDWTITQSYTFLTWYETPEIYKMEFNQTVASAPPLLYKGKKTAIYWAYLDLQTGKIYVQAYDVQNNSWTEPVYVVNVAADPHWTPGFGVFPNGSLVIFVGHSCELQASWTSLSAKTEGNLTKLMESFGSLTTIVSGLECSYPQAITFSDKLHLFYWVGTPSNAYYKWEYWTEAGRTSCGKLFNEDEYDSFYPVFRKHGKYILVTGRRYQYQNVSRDVVFCYYDGTYWRKYDGSILIRPINVSEIVVIKHSYLYGISVTLDHKNRPVILAAYHECRWSSVEERYKVMIAYYSKSVGEAFGQWILKQAENENGQKLFTFRRGVGTECILFDYYYNRTSLIINEKQNGTSTFDSKIAKYINYGDTPYVFKKIREYRQDAEGWYKSVSGEQAATYEFEANIVHYTLGFRKQGNIPYNLTKDYYYFVKIIPDSNVTVNVARILLLGNFTKPKEATVGSVAILNSTFTELTQGNINVGTQVPGMVNTNYSSPYWSRCITFDSTVNLTAGQTYWFRVQFTVNNTQLFFNETSDPQAGAYGPYPNSTD
ncbi:MAG: hypothetical protein DRN49_03480, partial [Thaumarchaeota archaeon]